MKKQTALEIICALLVILFLYTATSKFIDFTRFRKELQNQPFSIKWVPFLSWAVPVTETFAALLLLFNNTRLAGMMLSLFIMTAFTVYTALVLFHFFPRVPCSCGGVIRHLSWTQHLCLNIFFMVIATVGLWLIRHPSGQKKIM